MRVRPSRCLLVAAGLLAALSVSSAARAQQAPVQWLRPFQSEATRLIRTITADDAAWRRLAELTDTFGNRLSGSESLTRASAWAAVSTFSRVFSRTFG